MLATGEAAGTEWQLSWSVVWASSQPASSKHMLHIEGNAVSQWETPYQKLSHTSPLITEV